MNMGKVKYYTPPKWNKDDLNEAIKALDEFTKSWCMDLNKTEEKDEPMFRCDECEFEKKDRGTCMIKTFVHNHPCGYNLSDFGAMGGL